VVETPKLGVSTENSGNKIMKWKPGNLGVIINQYKRICTIYARKINPDFAWQSRFYEHIIRNEKSYNKISEYIHNNPLKWQDDRYYA
jgi:REP element-mobilizing transposase RayT